MLVFCVFFLKNDNGLHMWSMLHPHAKSLSSSWDYSGLYSNNNVIINIVEIVVLLTNHIITNMTS